MPPSSSLNDFEILTRLGKGSFGEVYKVIRRIDGHTYVMKQINISELNTREQHDAINEVHIMASLMNPYVVRYYDSFLDSQTGILCIIMEACEKGDLQHYLKAFNASFTSNILSTAGKAPMSINAPPFLPEEDIWNIFIQITIGLAYLHSKRTLHRDLKSANIFLTAVPSGSTTISSPIPSSSTIADDDQDSTSSTLSTRFGIKIGDLGVARVLGTDSYFAKTCVGTPYYLSPELCEDKPYNHKSDIWALGCVLYELCTGKHAFDARNQGALILKIIQGKYPPISTAYSNELHSLVNRLLNRDVRIRPSAAEILRDPYVQQKIHEFQFTVAPSILQDYEKMHEDQNVSSNIDNDRPVPSDGKVADDDDTDGTESHEGTFPPSLNIANIGIRENNGEDQTIAGPLSPLEEEADELAVAIQDRLLLSLSGNSFILPPPPPSQPPPSSDAVHSVESTNSNNNPTIPGRRPNKWLAVVPPVSVDVIDNNNNRNNIMSPRTINPPQPQPPQRPITTAAFSVSSTNPSNRPKTYADINNAKRAESSYSAECPRTQSGGVKGSVSSSSNYTKPVSRIRVRKGDPTAGIRPKKVLPLSEEARKAAEQAALKQQQQQQQQQQLLQRNNSNYHMRGNSSHGLRSPVSSCNNNGINNIHVPIKSENGTSNPSTPLSPPSTIKESKRYAAEVAALPEIPLDIPVITNNNGTNSTVPSTMVPKTGSVPFRNNNNNYGIKNDTMHKKRPTLDMLLAATTGTLAMNTAVPDDEADNDDHNNRTNDGNDITWKITPNNNANEDIYSPISPSMNDFGGNAYNNNGSGTEEEQPYYVPSTDSDTSYADVDDVNGNAMVVDEEYLAEIIAERQIVMNQANELQTVCERMIPVNILHQFLYSPQSTVSTSTIIPEDRSTTESNRNITTNQKNDNDEEDNDNIFDNENIPSEAYLLLYRLEYLNSRIRDLDQELQDAGIVL